MGEENSGDPPPPHVMLRNKIRNVTRRIDGLLKSRRIGAVENADPCAQEGTRDVVDEENESRGVLEHTSEPTGLEGAAALRSNESSEEDVEDDEELTEFLVKTMLSNSSRSGDKKWQIPQLDKNKSSSSDQVSALDVTWCPNTSLALEDRSAHRNLQSRMKDPEKNLQDGLFVPSRRVSQLNKLARKSIPDTTGAKWFNMPAQTLTPELKRELQLLRLRSVLDPKRHYKKEDSKKLPKYFQIGTVVEGPGEFFSSRLTKAERKSTFAEELLTDSSVQTFRKRKFAEIMERNQAGGKKRLKQRHNRKKRKS